MCIFIKTFVLWKKDVSIAAVYCMAAAIRNFVPTSAGTTIITGLIAIPIIL
jgi:hypothetical protein